MVVGAERCAANSAFYNKSKSTKKKKAGSYQQPVLSSVQSQPVPITLLVHLSQRLMYYISCLVDTLPPVLWTPFLSTSYKTSLYYCASCHAC